MGLDLSLSAVNKRTSKEFEVAYGRKTWFIYDYFKDMAKDSDHINDTDIRITFDMWNSFIKKIEEVIAILPTVIKAFNKYEKYGKVSKREKEVSITFYKWYNRTFNQTPTLGYEWDANALLAWYHANKVFLKYKKLGYSFILEASY